MVDPWLTNDPLWPLAERSPDKLKEIDVVIITHAHFDHAAGVDEIARHNKKVVFIAQFEYALSLPRRGITNVIPTAFGATVDFQGIKFSLIPASHTNSEMSPGTSPTLPTRKGIVSFLNSFPSRVPPGTW